MIGSLARKLFRCMGFELSRLREGVPFPPDFGREEIEIIEAVRAYTMTGLEELFALIQAVKYVVGAGIPGSIVECGVWRGGSMMAAALTLKKLGRTDVDCYLFDTFEGMSPPSDVDVSHTGRLASIRFEQTKRPQGGSEWAYADIEEVRRNMESIGYAADRVKFCKGRVEETIPAFAPEKISILRLDTDWYESTRHELIHLFPRLSAGGVLIVDDYGYWQGSRRAVDEYFAENNIHVLLHRIDYSGRVVIKI